MVKKSTQAKRYPDPYHPDLVRATLPIDAMTRDQRETMMGIATCLTNPLTRSVVRLIILARLTEELAALSGDEFRGTKAKRKK